jgi:hypothetical protein
MTANLQDLLHPSPDRMTRLLLWLVAGSYALFIGWTVAGGYRSAGRGEMPLYTDYTPAYAASLLVREIPAENLYRPRMMTEAGRRAARAIYGEDISDEQAGGVGFAPWMYPPTFILVIAPLACLPYLLSWFVWLIATAAPYLATIRYILPAPLAWPFALAAPPAFFNAMYGQTGFLVAGLIGLGLALLDRRPLWAGLLIGLASVKPHFGVLIPLALIAGGHWRTVAAATLTLIGTAIASILAFGDDPWFGFIGTTLFNLDGFAAGAYNFHAMTTVLSSLRLAGFAQDTAWLAQSASAALMAVVVTWAWWRGRTRPDTRSLQAAILCLATPLALPMAYLYDLVLVVPAAAWLWADLRQRGAHPGERALLIGAFAALLTVKAVATTFGVQIGPLLLALLLGLALRRHHAALGTAISVRGQPAIP